MNTHKNIIQNGFTLIELMIVIAIIGILMAYAIPVFQDYTTRSKAGECLSLSNGAKVAVSERWSALNNLAAISTNATAFLAPANTITGLNVSTVEVGANGVITCTFNVEDPDLAGNTILFIPADIGGSLSWTCDASSLTIEIRPGNC